MLKQHFQTILVSVGLFGMTWLCGCKTAGNQFHGRHDCNSCARTPCVENLLRAQKCDDREVAPPPPVEDGTPYDESVPKAAGSDDEQPASPETDEGTAADPRPKDGTDAGSQTEAAAESQEKLARLKQLGAVFDSDKGGKVVVADLSGTRATDSDLRLLADLETLEQLNLRGTSVTDAGLEQFKSLSSLKLLDLGKTAVTDEGLVHLKEMINLEYLLLGDTAITDGGIVHLQELVNLKGLSLIKSDITQAGVEKLKQLLPNCQVIVDVPKKETPEKTRTAPPPRAPKPQGAQEEDRQTKEPSPAGEQQDEQNEQRSVHAPSPAEQNILQTSRSQQAAAPTPVPVETSSTAPEQQQSAEPGLLSSTGEFYASRGRWSEAANALDKAVAASPSEGILRYRLAVALARTGDFEGALPHFVEVVGDAQAHYTLGVIMYENALEASQYHFLKALKSNPNFDDASFWLNEIQRARARMPRLEDPFRGVRTADLLPLPLICPADRQPTHARSHQPHEPL